jgi:uncharacterized membrane protein
MKNKWHFWLSLFTVLLSVISFASISRAQEPVAQAVLFYSPTCGHCKIVIEDVLPELDAVYGTQLQIYAVNTHTAIGDLLYQNFVTAFNISPEDQVVPMLLVGDQVLIGSQQIPDLLPGIVDEGLENGGIPWPEIEGLQEAMAGTLEVEETQETTFVEDPTLWDKFSGDLAGNILAVIVLVGMVTSLAITARNFIVEAAPSKELPTWIIPLLAILGIGVAGYLSYVEYNQVDAICGPVGNCNAVQQSSYATLFGILPVGIAGLLGYLGIILVWLLGQLSLPILNDLPDLLLWIFSLVGTLFSIYLTFLEPFVIGATCLWCLSSAIIMTAIYLLSSRKITFKHYE